MEEEEQQALARKFHWEPEHSNWERKEAPVSTEEPTQEEAQGEETHFEVGQREEVEFWPPRFWRTAKR